MAGGSSEDLRAHIESIATRTHREGEALSQRLRGGAWPGGGSDHTEPGALDWLRRWRASGPAPILPLCGCATGHCLLCN